MIPQTMHPHRFNLQFKWKFKKKNRKTQKSENKYAHETAARNPHLNDLQSE